MAERQKLRTQSSTTGGNARGIKSRGSLDAEIFIANGPDPVFVSDLEGNDPAGQMSEDHLNASFNAG